MTTSCIVKVTHCHSPKYRDGSTVYLLRRHDGADVLQAAALARHYRSTVNFHALYVTNHLLTRLVPGAGARDPKVQLYRPVKSIPDDIRYFYEIDCPDDYVFLNFAAGRGTDLEQQVRPVFPCELRKLVNDHRHAINLAVAELAAQDPIFALQSPYPMLD
jgi:hypothetical protein